MFLDQLNQCGLSRAEISRMWHVAPILSEMVPATGTVHKTIVLSTSNEKYVLRAYCYGQEDRARIVTEHALAAYVKACHVPAIAPLPLLSGETILEHEGRFYALYPFAEGQQIPREQVTASRIVAAMGRCLGQLHRTLSSYPCEQVRCQSLVVDPFATIAKIDRLEAAIAGKSDADAFDQGVGMQLMQRKSWLMTADAIDLEVLMAQEQQVLHGDYQETNLFFTDGQVSAIIDWDQAYVAPRCWEIIRTLHYVFEMDGPRSHSFLNAYRDVFPLSLEDLQRTAQVYGWVQANNLWAYTSYYLDQNDRVRHLLQTSFMPFEARWAEFANVLQ